MRSPIRWTVLIGALALVVGTVLPASADHATRPHTRDSQALGHSSQPGTFEVPDGRRTVNSDIAFRGDPDLQRQPRRVPDHRRHRAGRPAAGLVGGAAPECEATDPPVTKSMFFYDAATGAKLGQWTLPRPQSDAEDCTIHNDNIVPLRSGRYVAVSGNYQAGTWVTDFTDPANPATVAWPDPRPLVPPSLAAHGPRTGTTTWYNYPADEAEITKGLNDLGGSQ